MAETIADLEAQLVQLRKNRSLGVQKTRHGDRETFFMSDGELASAIADLERRISQQRNGRITTVRLSSSKGF